MTSEVTPTVDVFWNWLEAQIRGPVGLQHFKSSPSGVRGPDLWPFSLAFGHAPSTRHMV
jgi:hypothetical protein